MVVSLELLVMVKTQSLVGSLSLLTSPPPSEMPGKGHRKEDCEGFV